MGQKAELFLDLLSLPTRRAFLYFKESPILARTRWYLAGGTAMALQEGHRQSVDLDFFLPDKSFRETAWEKKLLATGKWETTFRDKGTLYGTLLGAKTSFIAYPFFVPGEPLLRQGQLGILSVKGIAAMKIIAISQRGRKRDFIDLYWYCKHKKPLAEVIERAFKQYPYQQHNVLHFFNSLTYFVDAEADPMPKIFFRASWKEIKKFFQTEVVKISKQYFGLK